MESDWCNDILVVNRDEKRDAIRNAWMRQAKFKRMFIETLLRSDDFEQWLYVISVNKNSPNHPQEFRDLIKSEINSPLSFPLFAVKTDAHFMLARMILTGMSAWEFKSGKRVIRP
jgi:hypothetical protein